MIYGAKICCLVWMWGMEALFHLYVLNQVRFSLSSSRGFWYEYQIRISLRNHNLQFPCVLAGSISCNMFVITLRFLHHSIDGVTLWMLQGMKISSMYLWEMKSSALIWIWYAWFWCLFYWSCIWWFLFLEYSCLLDIFHWK